jgi:hypothetical protein
MHAKSCFDPSRFPEWVVSETAHDETCFEAVFFFSRMQG